MEPTKIGYKNDFANHKNGLRRQTGDAGPPVRQAVCASVPPFLAELAWPFACLSVLPLGFREFQDRPHQFSTPSWGWTVKQSSQFGTLLPLLREDQDIGGECAGFEAEFGRYFADSLTFARRSDLSSSPTRGCDAAFVEMSTWICGHL